METRPSSSLRIVVSTQPTRWQLLGRAGSPDLRLSCQ